MLFVLILDRLSIIFSVKFQKYPCESNIGNVRRTVVVISSFRLALVVPPKNVTKRKNIISENIKINIKYK